MMGWVRAFVSRKQNPLRGLSSRYVIERELGEGGMAVVYLARDGELRRQVAIKVLRSTVTGERGSSARLAQEARMLAGLQHPHIVAIHDLEPLRERRFALVMQYVHGRTVRKAIEERGPLPVPVVERVLCEIAGALDYAHRRGIIHRDVKPENIFLEEETGRALLADFGIARAPHIEAGLTLAGEALGTPHYMSPEQIAGTPLDGRSDLYSLGLVGYEMLTGRMPWGGESLYQVLHKQQHEELPSPRGSRPDLPDRLLASLEHVLRKDPRDRPESGEAFRAGLLNGSSAEAAGDWSSDSGTATGKRRDPLPAVDAPTIRYRRDEEVPPPAAVVPEPAPPRWHEAVDWTIDPAPDAELRTLFNTPRPESTVSHAGPLAGAGKKTQSISPEAMEKPPERQGKGGGRAVILGGGVAATVFLLVLVSTMGSPGGPVETPAPVEEEVRAEPPPAAAASAPPASRSRGSAPRGGGRGSGGVEAAAPAAEWTYRPVGDLSDIFCRPNPDETREEWAGRVPRYCLDRAR